MAQLNGLSSYSVCYGATALELVSLQDGRKVLTSIQVMVFTTRIS